jgi:hypothetical protein
MVNLKRNLLNKFTTSALVFLLGLLVFSPALTTAAQLSTATDTMSNETQSGTSDHTFTWNSATGHSYVAADTVTVTSSTATNFTSAGSWATTDFELTMAGGSNGTSATNPVAVASSSPSCTSGAGHYTVTYTNSTSPSFVITLCTSFGTTGTAGAVTFKVKGGTGTGTLTNKSSPVSSALWTITDAGGNTDSTTIADVIISNDVVTVTATVNPTLSFSLGSNTVALGTLSSSARTAGAHSLSVATNGPGGFVVTYNGATLTNTSTGSHPMTVYAPSATPPTIGTEGFGINLKLNTAPVGSSANPVTNAGATCTPAANYNTADQYYFVASTATAITNMSAAADCTFEVSYMANISTVTPAGAYSTSITYIASATF